MRNDYFYARSLFEHGFLTNSRDKRLQRLAESCISKFCEGVPHCKIEHNVKICYEPDERKRTFEIVLYCENKGLCDKLFSGDAQQYMLNNKTDAAYRLLCQNDDISVPSYIKEAFEWISE